MINSLKHLFKRFSFRFSLIIYITAVCGMCCLRGRGSMLNLYVFTEEKYVHLYAKGGIFVKYSIFAA